ncbi:MAG TPA: RNA polymerase sigma factor [Anaerolineae bacterium]|nr:RNA polymerase sigma factor [Anaerolineae bacterium]
MNQPAVPFEQLVERYRAELLGYLVRLLGDVHDAEDVCQEALLHAYRAYGRLAPDSNARAWLYRIATNTAFNALKQRKRRLAHLMEIDLEKLAIDSTPAFEQREQLRAVVRAVEALPPKQRAALMLRQFQGLGYAEIAAALECNEAAARANVYQAIQRLRESLVD